jgi:hypothetical protein
MGIPLKPKSSPMMKMGPARVKYPALCTPAKLWLQEVKMPHQKSSSPEVPVRIPLHIEIEKFLPK